jgi:hypothetical protein
MSKYTHFTKLKHLIFLNGGSSSFIVLAPFQPSIFILPLQVFLHLTSVFHKLTNTAGNLFQFKFPHGKNQSNTICLDNIPNESNHIVEEHQGGDQNVEVVLAENNMCDKLPAERLCAVNGIENREEANTRGAFHLLYFKCHTFFFYSTLRNQ